jgi:hypothetical protein
MAIAANSSHCLFLYQIAAWNTVNAVNAATGSARYYCSHDRGSIAPWLTMEELSDRDCHEREADTHFLGCAGRDRRSWWRLLGSHPPSGLHLQLPDPEPRVPRDRIHTRFPFWPFRIRTTLHPRRRCVHVFRRAPFTASKTAVMTRSNVKLRGTASVSRHFSDTFPTLLRFFARFPRERSPV